jgi:hypothetical protein
VLDAPAPGRARLDLLAATRHDVFAAEDYLQIAAHGMRAARDGLRWHLIERSAPSCYDWSSFLPMLRAARDAGVQVVWDLCHYGWPDDLDIWGPEFVDRFARFAEAAARVVRDETDAVPAYCPVNEISYWAWAGGDCARFAPAARGRGGELKRQLVRASIAGIEAVRRVDPRARIVHADPLINVLPKSPKPADHAAAAAYHGAQYEAFDMLSGRLAPELGGRPEYLDVVGVNFYSDNQWTLGGSTIGFGHHLYRPFRSMLARCTPATGGRCWSPRRGRGHGPGRVAALRGLRGPGGPRGRGAGGGRLPLPGRGLSGLGERAQLRGRALLLADADGRRGVHGPLADELRRQQELLAAGRASSGLALGW